MVVKFACALAKRKAVVVNRAGRGVWKGRVEGGARESGGEKSRAATGCDPTRWSTMAHLDVQPGLGPERGSRVRVRTTGVQLRHILFGLLLRRPLRRQLSQPRVWQQRFSRVRRHGVRHRGKAHGVAIFLESTPPSRSCATL